MFTDIKFSWKNFNWYLKLPLILFIISSVLDLFFTTRNYIVLKYLPELNPLLGWMGHNYWLFLTTNIILCIVIILIYLNAFNDKKTKLMQKYGLYSIFLLVSCLRLVGAISNASWIGHEEMTTQQIEMLQEKVETSDTQIYTGIVWNWAVYPLIMLYTVFWLFMKALNLKEGKTWTN